MLKMQQPLTYANLLSMTDLSATDIDQLIDEAEAFKAGKQLTLTQPVYVSNLFFENSTRTHTSFEMAERRLGLTVVNFDPSTSSLSKGETMADTVKTLQAIGVQIAVIRHRDNDYYRPLLADPAVTLNLVNGGDGSGQHPSQSLLDLMTIHEEFGGFKGLKVAIVGDLAHSRVARSNMVALTELGAEVFFSGPADWCPAEFRAMGTYLPIDDLVDQMDVMMFLRVQHERLATDDNQAFSAEAYHQRYGLTVARAARMKDHAIIMHPAPVNRGVEIADALVEAPQSRIFPQMTNGVFMRMAILAGILRQQGVVEDDHANLH